MLFKQLGGLALSFLIGFTPINFDYWIDDLFPMTRTVSAHVATDFVIYDLGISQDLQTTSGVIQITNTSSVTHLYEVEYRHYIECSEACFMDFAGSGYQISATSFLVTSKQAFTKTPADMYAIRSFTSNSTVSQSLTFPTADSTLSISLTVDRMNGASFTQRVYFRAVTEGTYLNAITRNTLDTSNLLASLMLDDFFKDRNVPSSVINTVQQYLNNGDYSSAQTTINNYYNSTSQTESQENETIVNTFNTKDNNLNSLQNTEHQFTTGIENQFSNQIQNIPTTMDFSNQNNFIAASMWVKEQFDRITINTVYGSMLTFSLIVGFALAIIGRVLK